MGILFNLVIYNYISFFYLASTR